jgi:hypothetical protein
MNKNEREELGAQLAANLESFDDDHQHKCLKLFTMITLCFMEGADTTGVLLLRVKDTLTVAGMNIDTADAEDLIFSAANAFADIVEPPVSGEVH